MRLEDKVVVVTDVNSGIGGRVTRKSLDEGALVVGCGAKPEMHIESNKIICIQTNFTELAQAQYVVEETVKAFGRVNKLVCYVGATFVGFLEAMDYNTFMRELSINMDDVSSMYKVVISEPKKQEGSIVVSMGPGLGVRPTPERIGYCPSRAGAIMLTKRIALEYVPSIHVNAVLPGLVRIPMIGQRPTEAEDPKALEESHASLYLLHKMGKIEGVTNVTAFLSSNGSGFIIGRIMQICGSSLT